MDDLKMNPLQIADHIAVITVSLPGTKEAMRAFVEKRKPAFTVR